jgi:hypothetical protein
LNYVKDADIHVGYRSDQSSISVKLEFRTEVKNTIFWKFNSTLLKDKKYVEAINNVITQIKEQYAILVYNREKIETVPDEELELVISDQLFLDTLLMEIRKKTMEYAAKKKKEDKKTEEQLETDIKTLDEKHNKTELDIQELISKKEKLIEFRKDKMQGILLRSKARWAAEGEKITKYFCNLEK